MEYIKLNALARNSKGKGASRRLRNIGYTPAVVYGKNTETQSLAVKPSDLKRALSGALRINTPLCISINDSKTGKKEDILAIVRDHQYDPVSRDLLHIDFLSFVEGQELEVMIPIIKKGRSIGEQEGGVLRLIRHQVPVICKPKNIPESITVDVQELENNITFHVSELDLPEGVQVNLPPEKAILTITTVADDEEVAAEEAESETPETAEGEEKTEPAPAES